MTSRLGDMALPDAGARDDPFVGRLDAALGEIARQIVVGNRSRRKR